MLSKQGKEKVLGPYIIFLYVVFVKCLHSICLKAQRGGSAYILYLNGILYERNTAHRVVLVILLHFFGSIPIKIPFVCLSFNKFSKPGLDIYFTDIT